MDAPEVPASTVRRALDAIPPHALVVPLCALAAFASSAAVAALGAGGLVASFSAMLRQLAHGGAAGHGYGIIAAAVLWAAVAAVGAAGLALFVVVTTLFATAVGVILSGLIDLARLPRALPRTDHRWPRRVSARTAAVAAVTSLTLGVAARAGLGRVSPADVFFATLGGAAATVVAMLLGHALRWSARHARG